LSCALTEHGAIEIYVTTIALPPERWRLRFALSPASEPVVEAAQKAPGAAFPPRFVDARRELTRVLGAKSDVGRVKALRGALESALGARGTWSLDVCRALADALLEVERAPESAEHELAWLRLAGWCLRPGYGAPGDEQRVQRLVTRLVRGPVFPSKGQWGELWIAWRRVAAGIERGEQQRLFSEVLQLLSGPGGKGQAEMPALLAALERVPPLDKARAGELLWQRLPAGPFWPIGRLGARALVRAEATDVVPADRAEAWLARLLALDLGKAEGAAFAAAMIARLTGDPRRDLSDAARAAATKRLTEVGAPARWIALVTTATALDESDTGRLLGDALPAGLRAVG
jgi:hypothetical protein